MLDASRPYSSTALAFSRRSLGPLLLVALIAGVGVAIYYSGREVLEKRQAAQVQPVHGLIGSEKEQFLSDPRVTAILRKNGLELRVEKAGSRQIAQRQDIKNYDFGYPAGVPAATKLMQALGQKQSFQTFFTPMVIASWKPIADLLVAQGIAAPQSGGYYTLDMNKLLQVMQHGTRWKQLPGNAAYPVNKSILVSSTDVRKSNSAAMYLALASYVANGANVVQSDAEVARVLPVMTDLFLRQGYQEASTAGPFEDYLTMGMGKAPLTIIYEQQFIEHLVRSAKRNPDMVLMYPEPTVFTKHVLVPVTERGARLGQLLTEDQELQALALEYGFRTNDTAAFQEQVKRRSLAVAPELLEVIDPPSYEVMEKMIGAIESRFQ
jgi:hypothetical protein